jgi:hypothetical protein
MNNELPKNYLRLAAAVLAAFSLVLIFLPRPIMDLIGITYSPTGLLFLQFLGASLAGHAYLNWRAPNYGAVVVRLAYKMNIVALSLAVAISLIAIFFTSYKKICLLIFVVHIIFLSGFLVLMKRIPADGTAAEKNL